LSLLFHLIQPSRF